MRKNTFYNSNFGTFSVILSSFQHFLGLILQILALRAIFLIILLFFDRTPFAHTRFRVKNAAKNREEVIRVELWGRGKNKDFGQNIYHCWNRIQNKIRSLQDLIPLFSSGLWSFIASDSWNANFNQLSDFLRIFVFSRTAFTWNCIRSTSLQKISNRPTMSFQGRHWRKCLLIALCLSNQPCSFLWLKRVDSVFPM